MSSRRVKNCKLNDQKLMKGKISGHSFTESALSDPEQPEMVLWSASLESTSSQMAGQSKDSTEDGTRGNSKV